VPMGYRVASAGSLEWSGDLGTGIVRNQQGRAVTSTMGDYSASAGSTGIEDVPDVSADWYRDVVDFATTTPTWLQAFAGFFTDAALVLLGALMVACWWRARRLPARPMARALLAPVGMVVAYGVSEVVKSLLHVERPCRSVPGVVTVVDCPPPGDWSFPSNHSVIAGAVVLGLVFAWRPLGLGAIVIGVTAAASRVFVGAHYPHDAALGFALGAAVGTVIVLALSAPVTTLVGRLRGYGTFGRTLFGEAPAGAQGEPVPVPVAGAGPVEPETVRQALPVRPPVDLADQPTREVDLADLPTRRFPSVAPGRNPRRR